MRAADAPEHKTSIGHQSAKILKAQIALVVLGLLEQLMALAHRLIIPVKGVCMPDDMIILTRTFDLLTWLLPKVNEDDSEDGSA